MRKTSKQTGNVQCPQKVGQGHGARQDHGPSPHGIMNTLQGTRESLTPTKGYEMGTYSHPERQPHTEGGIA